MSRIVRIIFAAISAGGACLAAAVPPAAPPPASAQLPTDAAGIEFFESKVRPVLVERCYGCHSAAAPKLKGKLHLDTRQGMLTGGESQTPALVPGNLDDSLIITAIRYEEDGLQMPPKKKLPAAEIAAIEAWVKMGAPYPADAPAVASAAASHRPVAMTLEQGRKFWSFVPPKDSPLPAVKQTGWARNEIDRFILARLEAEGLHPSPPADKRTLIRRATYDLTGLPPTPAEIAHFENDPSADAYEKLLDRLLASPRYGERWGRYWLDVARYADTKGYVFEEERRYPFSYTYRDWVVRALNEDLPYDQFLIQQIAADRLDLKNDKRPLAAMGFLTLGRRFLNNQHDIIDDRIDVVCRGTMALTVSCARCHDHKYDPIPAADYYSLYGVFASSREPRELPLIGGDHPAQVKEFEAELAKRNAELDSFTGKRFTELAAALRTREMIAKYLIAAQKTVLPHPVSERFEVPDDTRGLSSFVTLRWENYLKSAAARAGAGAAAGAATDVFATWRRFAAVPPDQFQSKAPAILAQSRAAASENPLIARFVLAGGVPKNLQEVAQRYGAALAAYDSPEANPDPNIEALRLVLRSGDSPANVQIADAMRLFGNVDRARHRELQLKIDELIATHPGSPQRAMVLEDLPVPITPHILLRGNPANVGKQVPRQFPAILSGEKREPFKNGSGRLELAQKIASRDNPLTARVMVNRVWMYHFGNGIVRTPADFGTRGERPTHPQLLDWLAIRFAGEDGWSIKKLHKRMMLSAAYQQASADENTEARSKDPENRLLWRMNARRLDFEAMRDSLLAAGGNIDLTMGGKSVDIESAPFSRRRSIYAFIDRQNLPGLFRTFDLASPDSTSSRRFSTSIPQQALFMMNSPFVIEQVRKLAARPEIEAAKSPAERIEALYRATLGRKPTAEESALGMRFVQAEQSPPAEPVASNPTVWKYGVAGFDDASQRVVNFTPLPHFDGTTWQGGPTLPDPKLGWAMLNATGGHVGNDPQHGVSRRWMAPRDCTVTVSGELSNTSTQGDGVRARLISSREGQLASWTVHRKSADTRVSGIAVKQGDTVDFLVDCGRAGDYTFDQFQWNIKISRQPAPEAVAGDDAGGVWESATEFAGPAKKPAAPLSPWEKYAQVLLESNEFLFVD
jgi:hypothetical protein